MQNKPSENTLCCFYLSFVCLYVSKTHAKEKKRVDLNLKQRYDIEKIFLLMI